MAETADIVDDFYGVYLLYNLNPKYKGHTYIGYTRDPNRRIMQHNRGTWAGGAYRTSNKGPWKMVLIVHGFPNNISALRFEWAWQNPNKTIRLQHLHLKKIPRKETEVQFQIRVLTEMLRVGPWYRLPLTIQWLEKDFYQEFPSERRAPGHMKICFGEVKSRNRKTINDTIKPTVKCKLCHEYIKGKELRCLNENCGLVSHLPCLAELFLIPGEYIPIQGNCPFCSMMLQWGDLIKKMKGFNSHSEVKPDGGSDSDDDVVCTQDKVYVDNNSWFLTCDNDIL
ncbi:structure-specific endonuclease subunit SLX1 homolog [Leptidea sinapis]|uniref:Structure-specific endonuclease subunit SLX1 homolog n=1 Tax=Leptidea sinapis TaxID=189913 RepID=A0A5E4QKL2_9NEOP|nr:structure-specific endonuclease subunit SLX1 homolog [Leptidea sinapis]VVC98501.1 unnamed protein product [Leptidea sinapis]